MPTYVLFDYDLAGDAEPNSVELLSYLGEKIDKPKAVVIRETFSCFKKDWETDLRPEIPDYEKIAGEATKSGMTGKPLQARFIAQKLSSMTPVVIPPTLEAIIKAAMIVKYKGSCLSKKAALAAH